MIGMGCLHALILLSLMVCETGAREKELCISSESKKGCFEKASADCGSKWEQEEEARLCSEQDRFCLVKYSRVHRDCCIKASCKGRTVSLSMRIVLNIRTGEVNDGRFELQCSSSN